MIAQAKPLNEITTEAIHLLCREIGLVNTIRFINQFTTGYGNYTEERDRLFGDMTLSDILIEVKKMRKTQKT